MTLEELEQKCKAEMAKRAVRSRFFEAIGDQDNMMFSRGQTHMCATIISWIQEGRNEPEKSAEA